MVWSYVTCIYKCIFISLSNDNFVLITSNKRVNATTATTTFSSNTKTTKNIVWIYVESKLNGIYARKHDMWWTTRCQKRRCNLNLCAHFDSWFSLFQLLVLRIVFNDRKRQSTYYGVPTVDVKANKVKSSGKCARTHTHAHTIFRFWYRSWIDAKNDRFHSSSSCCCFCFRITCLFACP